MQARCLIQNAHVVSPGVEYSSATIEIADGIIVGIHETPPDQSGQATLFDARGLTVVPGFIDIHTHGAAGHDFCDGSIESIQAIAQAKLREGVTTFLPTTLTVPFPILEKAFESARIYQSNPEFARAPGIHLEGPFINPKCTGAQNPKYVRSPDIEEIQQLGQIAPIKIVSLAVEMDGGMELTRSLSDNGIVPSLAHTAATFEQFEQAKSLGAKHLTHFCNQMTPLHHREIGLVGAGLLDNEILIEMICDGIHLVPEMIQLAYKVVGHERIMLITDSMAASGLADNQTCRLGELEVIVKDGVARLPSGALAGSTLWLNRALKNVHEFTGIPLPQLIQTTAWNQAQSLNLPQLGKIEAGFHADLTVLDRDFVPQAVFVAGNEKLGNLSPL